MISLNRQGGKKLMLKTTTGTGGLVVPFQNSYTTPATEGILQWTSNEIAWCKHRYRCSVLRSESMLLLCGTDDDRSGCDDDIMRWLPFDRSRTIEAFIANHDRFGVIHRSPWIRFIVYISVRTSSKPTPRNDSTVLAARCICELLHTPISRSTTYIKMGYQLDGIVSTIMETLAVLLSK